MNIFKIFFIRKQNIHHQFLYRTFDFSCKYLYAVINILSWSPIDNVNKLKFHKCHSEFTFISEILDSRRNKCAELCIKTFSSKCTTRIFLYHAYICCIYDIWSMKNANDTRIHAYYYYIILQTIEFDPAKGKNVL